MKLHLLNFRKYDNVIFDIKDGITKITGESGAGKSTIFEAIYWCLYGKLNDVATKGGSGSTEVTFEIKCLHNNVPIEVRITRTGKKNVSILIIEDTSDQEFHGEQAQAHINSIFGTHDTFLMTSYLRAENMHKLISAMPSEKRELTGLLFPGAGKYDEYKDKLVAIRKRDEGIFSSINTNIAAISASISTLEVSNPWLKIETPTDPTTTEKDISNEINKLVKERDNIRSIKTTYTLYKGQLDNLPPDVDTIPIQQEVESIQQRIIATVVSGKSKEIQIKSLEEQISSIEEEMNKCLIDIGKDTLSTNECNRILPLINELLSIAPSLSSMLETIENLRKEYDTLFAKSIEYDKSIENIEYNRKLEDILECPQCHAKLCHTNVLSLVTTDISLKPVLHEITRNDVNKLHLSLDRINEKRQTLMKQYTRFEEVISKEQFLKDKDLKLLKDTICTYNHLQKTYLTLKQQLSSLELDTREYISQDEYKKLQARQKKLQDQITNAIATQQQRQTLTFQVRDLESKYDWLLSDEDKVASIDEKISSMRQLLIDVRQAKEKMRIYTMYTKGRVDLTKLQEQAQMYRTRIDASYSLESILAQVYQEYVGNKLREIECDICELGKIFFDETMNITLTPGKETSTGTIKPSFDIQVEYDDIEHTDIRAMSTGERKRLSLILFIILTKYMDGKFMMLDEALTSVGMDTRGIILGELAQIRIPILITSHDDIVGGYHNEIRLDSSQ